MHTLGVILLSLAVSHPGWGLVVELHTRAGHLALRGRGAEWNAMPPRGPAHETCQFLVTHDVGRYEFQSAFVPKSGLRLMVSYEAPRPYLRLDYKDWHAVMSYHPASDLWVPFGKTLHRPLHDRWVPLSYPARQCGVLWILYNTASAYRNTAASRILAKVKCADIRAVSCQQLPTRACSTAMPQQTDFFVMLRQFRVYLAFEDADADFYITEDTWRSLAMGLVPAILSRRCWQLELLLPEGSYIARCQFDTFDAFADKVALVANDIEAYNAYQEWRAVSSVYYDYLRDAPPRAGTNQSSEGMDIMQAICDWALAGVKKKRHGLKQQALSVSEIVYRVGSLYTDYYLSESQSLMS
jgi:hypothetical protein